MAGRNVDHLRHRADFQAVMAAEVVARTAHFVLHRRLAHLEPSMTATPAVAESPKESHPVSRVGAVLPKRLARRAVTRNALKRQIYSVMTAFDDRLPRADHVVRLRSTFDRTQFLSATSVQLKQAARRELEQLVSKVIRP
jgi:ribonuclease P protein component